MKKIFVTGGSGFIGSHLIDKLVCMGHEVTNYDLNPNLLNIDVNYINGDILDKDKLNSCMQNHDAVCHLAALVGVAECIKREAEVMRVNYEGVRNVLECCKKNDIDNIVFASSSEVYGNNKANEYLTEELTLQPISPYGKAKMLSEILMEEFYAETKITSTALRYCNIYGERQRADFVIPLFIDGVLKNKKISVCSNGEQVRTYTYVADAVDTTIKVLLKDDSAFKIYNVCSDSSYDVKTIAHKIIGLNDNFGDMEFVSYEELGRLSEYEIIKRISLNHKIKEDLNFNPKTEIDEGLKKTFFYYKTKYYQQGDLK